METHCMRWTHSRHAFSPPPPRRVVDGSQSRLFVRGYVRKKNWTPDIARDYYDDDDDRYGALFFVFLVNKLVVSC